MDLQFPFKYYNFGFLHKAFVLSHFRRVIVSYIVQFQPYWPRIKTNIHKAIKVIHVSCKPIERYFCSSICKPLARSCCVSLIFGFMINSCFHEFRMEFFTYNKIHFTDIVEIRILIRVGPLMDIAMYSINTYTDLVEIRYDRISVMFVLLFSFPRKLNLK
jgi:hypothetical protein